MGTVLAVSASPRRQGNSEMLLQSFSQGLQKEGKNVKIIRISDLDFRPCNACEKCATTGECVLRDDMQDIYPLVTSSGAMVIATPIYFGTLSGQLKMFIDRFQCWWFANYKLDNPRVKPEEGRPGFFLCVGGAKVRAHSESALAVAKIYFQTINYHFADYLCYHGIDEKGMIREHPDALQNAYGAGRRFAEKILHLPMMKNDDSEIF